MPAASITRIRSGSAAATSSNLPAPAGKIRPACCSMRSLTPSRPAARLRPSSASRSSSRVNCGRHSPTANPLIASTASRSSPRCDPLVDRRRVEEAISNYHRSPLQGRDQLRANQLCAARGEQQELRFVAHVAGLGGVLQQFADPLSDEGPAGLPRQQHLAPRRLKAFAQQLDLGRLPTPLRSLKTEEESVAGLSMLLGIDPAAHLRLVRGDLSNR